HIYAAFPTFPLLCFLFYCSAHPRVLHSFPTRRSSDLPKARCLAGARSSLNDAITAFGRKRIHCGLDRCGGGVTALFDRLEQGFRDRKSTRLNSSHVKISYAVFCLKKKRTKKYTQQHTD